MKFKIDRSLLPIKAHFFFFFAGLGPLLPQLNMFGRQLGVSPAVMGMVTAVLPLLWAAAKPLFGYAVDFWPAHRKLIFMMLITVMTGSYCCLWFLPMPKEPLSMEPPIIESIYKLDEFVYIKKFSNETFLEKFSCQWNCSKDDRFEFYLPNTNLVNTVFVDEAVNNDSCSLYHMNLSQARKGEVMCIPNDGCNLFCYDDSIDNSTILERNRREISNRTDNYLNLDADKDGGIKHGHSKLTMLKQAGTVEEKIEDKSFYTTPTFWAFVVLMCVGTVAFNVANCIGDAVCFDVLGPERGSKYGAQRAWGTVGYGVTALLGGVLVDAVSNGGPKDFTPAFIVALVATLIDLYSCRALTLPSLTSPDDKGAALRQVLRMPRVMVFITFAVIAGTFDSFIIYYLFWFLEEMAEQTDTMDKIKIIEGVVIAAQCFTGELLFFYYSGKIIEKLGYGTTMTVALFFYGVRMALISLIQHPWHLVYIEAIMQGPTYALCYSTIVGYAAQVAPEGYSATIQGIVAGMDDGVGFAVGSLVGGQLYGWAGGRSSFQLLAIVAVASSAVHALLFPLVLRRTEKKEEKEAEATTPEEGEKMLPTPQEYGNGIYNDTVVPLNQEKNTSASR